MKKQSWHNEFFQSLAELANVEAQQQEWLAGGGASLPAPSELVCQVFDDSGLDNLLANGQVFSSAADAVLREMSDLVTKIDLEQDPENILRDARWLELTTLAEKAVKLVSEVIED